MSLQASPSARGRSIVGGLESDGRVIRDSTSRVVGILHHRHAQSTHTVTGTNTEAADALVVEDFGIGLRGRESRAGK